MSGQQVRRLSATGVSSWMMLDTRRKWFGAAIGVKLSSGASITYTVQHTFDDMWTKFEDFTATRVTTTVTINRVNHGLSVGDWCYQEGVGAPMVGEHTVASVVDADNFTYTVANSGVTSGAGSRMATARVFPHEELVAKTASDDGNYMFPPAASRLNITWVSGFAEMTLLQQGA